MVYDYYKEQGKKMLKGKMFVVVALLVLAVLAVVGSNIYLQILQFNEIGNYAGVYLTNLTYQLVFFGVSFVVIFLAFGITGIFTKANLKKYLEENGRPQRKLPNFSLAAVAALVGAFFAQSYFFQKALNFLHASTFGSQDPIFSKDIGYYVFQRPFFMSVYGFVSTLWIFVIVYTALYYIAVLLSVFNNDLTLENLKVKTIIRHNLVNIAIFFIIKAFSYKFQSEGILYSNVVGVSGGGYVDVNVWLNYFKVAPFLLVLIVAASFAFILMGKLRGAAYTIAVFPVVWLIVSIAAMVIQGVIVKPNEINLESKYLKYNMEKTREAFNINKIKSVEFPVTQDLTPDIINRNIETKNNIRVVDYKATLDSDKQLQSNTNFYSFHDGDIINYTINGKDIPVFITAREIDKENLPDKTYLNTMFKYTHGYGIVMNPINRLTSGGQVDFILSSLRMDSIDKNLKINEPRIYYGELTNDPVIVNAGNNLGEIDYDGNSETRYTGKGGAKLGLMNKLLFAMKYGDVNMLISPLASSDSRLLLNRNIVARAQKAAPFLSIDEDPYIISTADGRLKWVLDAYTTTSYYPYSQDYGGFNYIRNSVKVVVDAYDGTVEYYIIDKNDPIINTYKKIYPGVFTDKPLPADVAAHMRYPEFLFKVQTDILKRYHLDPNANTKNVSTFYSLQDLWDIAKYPEHDYNKDVNDVRDIDPYYNMVKLPGDAGNKEELILMRPFTPSKKNNMVSWLAVRNSAENYGEMIFYNFPKNTNILGPYQVEVKINQLDKVSKDMTLWGQSGSRVFKGSLLVIPIESSVLYVEPIYIQAAGSSSIPEMREIVLGYQEGEEFKYGIGTSLDEAMGQLFQGIQPTPLAPGATTTPAAPSQTPPTTGATDREKVISDIQSKLDSLRKQIDELGNLLNELKK